MELGGVSYALCGLVFFVSLLPMLCCYEGSPWCLVVDQVFQLVYALIFNYHKTLLFFFFYFYIAITKKEKKIINSTLCELMRQASFQKSNTLSYE
ncbi:hypothetical protein QVD17_27143 [Tagetes erecta]|uniref:Uncharacterized protein n=1 Tax=Tagetes erecta TaxID=13708 RepID=A0AAD8NQZ8_TARER|nr:hypothetical protein QVD17_27143 [Tagetes erecta]